LARFHTHPSLGSQRRIVAAEVVIPRVVCHVRASVAQRQRVRHQP
jgi:hypothetical protein